MARMYKCYGTCGNKYEAEEMSVLGGKKYCFSCKEAKESKEKAMKELYATIKRLYNINFPTGLMLKQIKQYAEERSYTYEGMTQTLKYLQNKGVAFNPTYGLGLISYEYENAQAFFKQQEQIAIASIFSNGKAEFDEVIVKTAKPNNVNAIKRERLIDLEELI